MSCSGAGKGRDRVANYVEEIVEKSPRRPNYPPPRHASSVVMVPQSRLVLAPWSVHEASSFISIRFFSPRSIPPYHLHRNRFPNLHPVSHPSLPPRLPLITASQDLPTPPDRSMQRPSRPQLNVHTHHPAQRPSERRQSSHSGQSPARTPSSAPPGQRYSGAILLSTPLGGTAPMPSRDAHAQAFRGAASASQDNFVLPPWAWIFHGRWLEAVSRAVAARIGVVGGLGDETMRFELGSAGRVGYRR